MENNNNSFEYTYSASRQAEVKRIREKYLPKEEDKMEQLRKLDKSAAQKGMVVAIVVGIISALLLGIGMSCTMVFDEIYFIPGVIIGIVGIIGASFAYPLYAHITKNKEQKSHLKLYD